MLAPEERVEAAGRRVGARVGDGAGERDRAGEDDDAEDELEEEDSGGVPSSQPL